MYVTYASYLMDMKGIITMGIMELRRSLGQRIDAAHFHGEPTIIQNDKKKEPRAAIVPYGWLVDMCKQRGIPVPGDDPAADEG
jgi:hypothetical protein